MARSRVRPAICILVRIDHTWLGRSGGFAPINLPLFQGGRRAGFPVVFCSLSFIVDLLVEEADQHAAVDRARWLS